MKCHNVTLFFLVLKSLLIISLTADNIINSIINNSIILKLYNYYTEQK